MIEPCNNYRGFSAIVKEFQVLVDLMNEKVLLKFVESYSLSQQQT